VNVLVMMDIATGLSIEPPTAWIIRKATSQPRPGARLHSSEPTVNTARPAWNVLRRPIRSAVDPENIKQARQHQRVRVDRPLQPGHGRMQLASDRRQRDVHDRAVQADNEQAQAANAQHEQATPADQFRQADHLARSGPCPEYLRSCNYL
jgi:hypothetical protein